jgi:hypothetical protein
MRMSGSPREIGAELKLDHSEVRRILDGQTPSLATAHKIKRYLSIRTSYWLETVSEHNAEE